MEYGIEWEDGQGGVVLTNLDEESGSAAGEQEGGRKKKENPIMISSQHGFSLCTQLLYEHGYRIPQISKESEKTNEFQCQQILTDRGDGEDFRFKKVVACPGGKEDQVDRLMLFKAYADPQYLSLPLTQEVGLEIPDEQKAYEILALQKIDPLRRAFDLADKAESLTSSLFGMAELKANYKEIQEGLETFTASLLTSCSSTEEVKAILEHNPNNEDEDEDDAEEQNWQKVLLEGRKAFVAHPYYQQYFFQRIFGKTKVGPSSRLQRFPSLDRIAWNLQHIPLAIFLFLFYPFVVFADFFRDADLLFVRSETIEKRKKDKFEEGAKESTENSFFAFFREKIHTSVYRMIVYHFLYAAFLLILILMVADRQ